MGYLKLGWAGRRGPLPLRAGDPHPTRHLRGQLVEPQSRKQANGRVWIPGGDEGEAVVLCDRGLRMPIETSAHALEFAPTFKPTQVSGGEVPFFKVAGPQDASPLGEAKNLLGLAGPAGAPRIRARCRVDL